MKKENDIKLLNEADDTYTSVANAPKPFNPSKPDLNFDDSTENQSADKTKLTKMALDKITQSLEVSDELQSILNQIKKLNTEEGSNEWKINEEGNTATLKNKNARIFKQNNNLCLSYNDKVELFNSVAELHSWLKSHNMPLPKGIQLHEAKGGFNILPDSPWYNILNNKTTADGMKIGDKTTWTKDDADELKLQNRKPVVKMGRTAYKNATQFMKQSELDPSKWHQTKTKEFPESINEENQLDKDMLWYLEYQDKNHESSLYLNQDWQESNLLTDNLDHAAVFPTRETAMQEVRIVYALHDTDAPFKPIQNSTLGECFGGEITTGTLGSAVTYTADKDKKEALDEETELKEVMGFPGTPFENVKYAKAVTRAKEYLKWLAGKDEYGRHNLALDPNHEEHEQQAIADYNKEMMTNAIYWDWDALFKKYLDPKTGRPLNKEEFRKYILDTVNPKYGIDINPDEDILTKNYVQDPNRPNLTKADFAVRSPHNTAQFKAFGDWYRANKYDSIGNPIWKKDLDAAKSEYQKTLNNPSSDSQTNITGIINNLSQLIDNNLPDDQVMNEIVKYKSKLSPTDFNLLVDQIVTAGKNGQLDLNDTMLMMLPYVKTSTQTESIFNKTKNTELKEDDSPADFATGPAPDNNNTTVNVSQDSPEAPESTNDTPDMGMNTPEGNSAPAASFGDINIGGGSGGYGPEEDIPAAPMLNEPEYQIIDVLVNDQDDTDVKVKVKNLDTGKIETKNLNEIDV
jgi:hypothetical protein